MPRLDRPLQFSEHAHYNLRHRDVSEQEVIDALETPASRHKHRKDGKSECWSRVPNKGVLKVIYEKRPAVIRVVTLIWE